MQACWKCGLEKDIREFSVGRAKVHNCIACRSVPVRPAKRTRKVAPIGAAARRDIVINDSEDELLSFEHDVPYTGVPPPMVVLDYQDDVVRSPNPKLLLELDLSLDYCDDSEEDSRCRHSVSKKTCLICRDYKTFLGLKCIHGSFIMDCRSCEVVCYHGNASFQDCELCLRGNICPHSNYRLTCEICRLCKLSCKHLVRASTCSKCFQLRTHHRAFHPV